MTSQQQTQVYISYAGVYRDMEIKNELVRYLASFAGDQLAISFGEEKMWMLDPKRQQEMILTADIVIVLVSENYLVNVPSFIKEALPFILNSTQTRRRLLPILIDTERLKDYGYSSAFRFPIYGTLESYPDRNLVYGEILNALTSMAELLRNSEVMAIIDDEKKLKTGSLVLSGKGLRQVPVDILEMDWLEKIVLNNNNISTIEHLQKVVKLTHLELAHNHIGIVENLNQLTNLKELHLNNNEINSLDDDGLEWLAQLERLELHNNHIKRIAGLSQSKNLKVLGLSNNQLTSLDEVRELKNLETLYAAHNKIEDLTPLENLPIINRLVLTNNRIKSIKPLLRHIRDRHLTIAYEYNFNEEDYGIYISENTTLNEPSVETVMAGRDAVLKYFEDIDTIPVQKLEVFKLVLVGNSRVGKTNFSQLIMGKAVDHNSKSTHLLDIQGWDAPFLKSEKETLTHVKIFDFGGQDYYHDSHRLYYSHDTAYVLLWDKTTNKYNEITDTHPETHESFSYENYPLEYWLESIEYNITQKELPVFKDAQGIETKRSKSKSAPVLVIQNKIDEGEAMVNQKGLSEKYNNIWGFYSISITKEKRTAMLPQLLSDYLYALDLSGRLLLQFEISVVRHFMQSTEPLEILSLDEFHRRCIGIVNDDTVSFNLDNALIMAQTLSNIGVILFEKTAEKSGIIYTNIIQLNKLVKVVMEIAKGESDRGIFKRDELQEIMHCDAIIDLLLRNNSIIKINEDEFLAPQFLPIGPDPSIQFFLHSFSYTNIRFVYKAYFHKTLLLTLFAKYLDSQYIDRSKGLNRFQFWRNGIIIKRENPTTGTGEMVFVEFEKNDAMGVINIRTMRPFNSLGLEREIEQTLDELSKGWTYEKQVSIDGRQYFSVEHLQKSAGVKQYSFVHDPNIFNTDKTYWSNLNNPTLTTTATLGVFSKNFTANDFKHLVQFASLPKKLFISYSSKNALFIKRFVTHLETLKSNKLIDPWYDRMIESGTRWDDAIRTEMDLADVVIFMLSPDFLATEYIMIEEVPMAIERYKLNRSKFYFVQLLPCNWAKTDLQQFQQTDNAANPLKNVICINTPDNDAAWVEVVNDLEAKVSPPKI